MNSEPDSPTPQEAPIIQNTPVPQDAPTAHGPAALIRQMREQIRHVILGQDAVVEQVLAALLAGGHVLLEGKPGLGKTHLVTTLAKTFGGSSARIQFTPDLMPSDVTGFRLFDMKSQTFQLRHGPVFTNLLLADEINRAPAKTQSALLEVMQEQQVTIDGETLKLAPPFMTLATQNPVEHEGTYPLPEAQLDRFIMKVLIDYPVREAECEIVTRAAAETPGAARDEVSIICGPEEIVSAQRATAAVQVVPEVVAYAVSLAQATRESRSVSLGAGTRGAISLVKIGKAFAALDGRGFVTPDDIKRAALPVLRHRVQLTPEVAISGQEVDEVLQAIVESVPAPRQ
ncbi:MoxR family ATPase [Luteolibacter yonseiensis]|uniref:MoxR family ATPase n=1 Tax=Luteolibacter yonseiensis TaxID=1144680 RepID=A0A934R6B2_9BACT|nr:MoxR family ATPase [Luteolibacter yonseiensis]MBK1817782.1 MoxR family ATPase [Luteolibacter yonseiensis]